jgi:proteasome lid subunit RPN8/RPN11
MSPNINKDKDEKEEGGIFERSMKAPELSKYLTEEKKKSDYSDTSVILNWKAYRRIVGYSHRYANDEISSKDWKEVYGILIGSVIKDQKLIVKDAIPMVVGDRAGVKYEDKQYVDMAQIDQSVYQNSIKNEKSDFIVGWFHTHPGFGFFFSSVDATTQLGYQLPNPFAAAIIYDHTKRKEEKTGMSLLRLENPNKSMFSAHMKVPLEYSPSKKFILQRIDREIEKIDKNMEDTLEDLHYIENTLEKKAFAELQENFGLLPKKTKPLTSFDDYLEASKEEELKEWDENNEFGKKYEMPPFKKKVEHQLEEYEKKLKNLKEARDLKDFQKKREKSIKKANEMLKKPNEWFSKLRSDFQEKQKAIEPFYEYLDTNEREIINSFSMKLKMYKMILDEFNSKAQLKSIE